MSKIRKKNTRAEILLRKALCKNGMRGYRIHYPVPGCPDIVYVSLKIAIFVDGDFWHGYLWKNKGQVPPKEYWQKKIEGNMDRDKKINSELKKHGWKVIRVWEHEILKDSDKIVKKIMKISSSLNTDIHNSKEWPDSHVYSPGERS